MFFSVDDLIAQSQQADLKQEEERLKQENLARKALLAKRQAAGQYNMSQLLAKMAGSEAEAPAPDAPKPVIPKEKPNAEFRFPPPPLGK